MFPWFMENAKIYNWKFKHIEETDSTKETTEKQTFEKVSDKPSAMKALKENSKELNLKVSESAAKVDAS